MKTEQFWEGVYRDLAPTDLALMRSIFTTEQPEAQQFLRKLPQGATVLDYGCGVGRNTIPLLGRGMEVVVYDISETAMNLCVQNASRHGFSPLVASISAGKLTSQVDQYDGILAWSVLDHMSLPEAVEVEKTLMKAARPGALLLAAFDGPEEIDEPLRQLPDGSMQILAGKRAGMILRTFSDAEVKSLFIGWEPVSYSGGPKQRKVILCRRKSAATELPAPEAASEHAPGQE